MNFLTPVIGRILAAWIAALASWLMVKYGITISPDNQAGIVGHMVSIIIPAFLTIYAIAHKVLNKHFNPGDAASSHLADKEAGEAAVLKAQDRR